MLYSLVLILLIARAYTKYNRLLYRHTKTDPNTKALVKKKTQIA